MSIFIMWDVNSSNGEFLQHVGSGMGHYLHMARVGYEGDRMSSLSLPRPLCEVAYLTICILNDFK